MRLSGSAVRAPEIPALPPARLPAERASGWLTTGIGTAVDATLMRAMTLVVERALIPDANDVDALRRSAAPLLDPALQNAPQRFFEFTRQDAPLAVTTRFSRRLPGGRAQRC